MNNTSLMHSLLKITLLAFMCLSASTQTAISQTLSENASKGFEIIKGRTGQCVLCHQFPNNPSPMGNIGPPLQGVAKRMSERSLRERLADERNFNPQTIMPPYFSTQNLSEVDPTLEGKTILSAQEFEQVVAYLMQLN